MSINYKSKLQEECQKRKITLPEYATHNLGGQAHAPLFQSTVYFDLIKSVTGEAGCKTKVEAEQSAAKIAINSHFDRLLIEEATPKKLRIPDSFYNVLIYVDYENQPSAVKYLLDHLENCAKMCAYISAFHHSSGVIFPQGVNKRLIKSSRKDACDMAITLDIGSVMGNAEAFCDYLFIIVTRDNFASSVQDVINTDNQGFKCVHLPCAEEVIKYLQEQIEQ
jgi:hypothetical protein